MENNTPKAKRTQEPGPGYFCPDSPEPKTTRPYTVDPELEDIARDLAQELDRIELVARLRVELVGRRRLAIIAALVSAQLVTLNKMTPTPTQTPDPYDDPLPADDVPPDDVSTLTPEAQNLLDAVEKQMIRDGELKPRKTPSRKKKARGLDKKPKQGYNGIR